MGIYMKKGDETLFKIGEIAKILGVARKTILVYEEMGLLIPAAWLIYIAIKAFTPSVKNSFSV